MAGETNIRIRVRFQDADGNEQETWWPIERLHELIEQGLRATIEETGARWAAGQQDAATPPDESA